MKHISIYGALALICFASSAYAGKISVSAPPETIEFLVIPPNPSIGFCARNIHIDQPYEAFLALQPEQLGQLLCRRQEAQYVAGSINFTVTRNLTFVHADCVQYCKRNFDTPPDMM